MQLETPLDQLLETGGHVRVLRALVALPRGFAASARDMARRAGVAHTTASRVLRGLAKARLVERQRAGRADLYRLNDQHVLAGQVRALFESESKVREQLIDYLRSELPGRVGPAEGAYLFGSVRRGSTRPTSDVDVAVVGAERSEAELELSLSEIANRIRERFGIELNVIVGPGARKRGRAPLWQRLEREGLQLMPKKMRRG
jgi:predicted nucleotidyltransferase